MDSKVLTLKVQAPKVQATKVQAPKVQAPKVEAPKAQAPKFQAPKAHPKVTEEDLLQAFKQFVKMLDISFQPEDKTSVTAAEKLAAEYIPFFKNAAHTLSNQRQLRTLSWNAIIDATKDSLFFEANPEFLENHNSDLKYKPSVKHNGLHQFAHSPTQLTSEVAKQLAAELIELSIFNKNIDVNRLLALKKGLLTQKILIDGFQEPYQVLIPFLTLGCLRLERYEAEDDLEEDEQAEDAEDDLGEGEQAEEAEDDPEEDEQAEDAEDGPEEDDINVENIVLDVLADTVNVLSAAGSLARMPAAARN